MGLFASSRLPEKPKEPIVRTVFNIVAVVIGIFGFDLEMEGTHPFVGIFFMASALAYAFYELFTSKVTISKFPPAVRTVFIVALSAIVIWASWRHLAALIAGKTVSPSSETRYEKPKPEPPKIVPTPNFPTRQVSLIFKDTPLLTKARKEHIIRTIDEFYSYLTGLGFPIHKDFPAIGISRDNVFRSSGIYPGSIYGKHILLPRNRVDDVNTIRWAFAGEVFKDMFYSDAPSKNGLFKLQIADIYALYYVSSIGGHRFGSNNLWLKKLWAVRGKEGKDFTDRAMFYTYKMWNDPAAGDPATNDKDFNNFFYLKFTGGGANVVSNGFEQLDEVMKTLNSINN